MQLNREKTTNKVSAGIIIESYLVERRENFKVKKGIVNSDIKETLSYAVKQKKYN